MTTRREFIMAMLFISASLTADEEGTLFLFREWANGMVTGWLPIHRAAIVLCYVSGPTPASWPLNDAKTLHLPLPDRRVEVAGEERVIEGVRYVPVETSVNLCSIGQTRFYVKRIIFGESRWRVPTQHGS